MSDQPFKPEDVIWRWRPMSGWPNSPTEVVVSRTSLSTSGVAIYTLRPSNVWKWGDGGPHVIAELLRQMTEKDKEIERLTDEPACVSCGDGLHNQGLQQVLAAANVRIAELEAKMTKYQEALAVRDEYAKLLGEEANEFAAFAWTHGIRSSRVEAGKDLRRRIADADAALADQPALILAGQPAEEKEGETHGDV